MTPIRIDTAIENRTFATPTTKDDLVISDRSLAYLLPEGGSYLDLGAGSGRDLEVLKSRFPDARLVGLEKVMRETKFGGCEWIDADATLTLPFADQEFDVVYANGLFAEISDSDIVSALIEMKRIGKQVFYSEVYPDLSTGFFNG